MSLWLIGPTYNWTGLGGEGRVQRASRSHQSRLGGGCDGSNGQLYRGVRFEFRNVARRCDATHSKEAQAEKRSSRYCGDQGKLTLRCNAEKDREVLVLELRRDPEKVSAP
jgi:hypothetical protein